MISIFEMLMSICLRPSKIHHKQGTQSGSLEALPRQHVAFVYDKDAKTQSIYIDGTLDKTCSAPWLETRGKLLESL